MRKLYMVLIFLISSISFGQYQFNYFYYQIDPVDINQFFWDTTDVDDHYWQFGNNQKAFFNFQFETNDEMLVTDTFYMYQDSLDAKVDLILTRPDQYMAFVLKFYHKIDTDNSNAGGYVEFNVDNDSLSYVKNGDTLNSYWFKFFLEAGDSSNIDESYLPNYPVITETGDTAFLLNSYDYMMYQEINGYHDSLFNNVVGFTGTYNKWELFYTEFFFTTCAKAFDVVDTLNYRFHFVSDSIYSNKNGWGLRNIQTGLAERECYGFQNLKEEIYRIYPNPIHELVYFNRKTEGNGKREKILIMDSSGKLIIEQFLDSKMILDVSQLNSGIYFCHIMDSNNHIIQKDKLIKL